MDINSIRLKELRKEKGVTQSVVADEAGLSIKTIYRYEKDRVKRCELETIKKLADYYGVDSSCIVEARNDE